MGKFRTIDSFFKKNENNNSENSTLLGSNVEASTSKSPRIDPKKHPSRLSVVEVELFYISYTHKQKKLYMAPPQI